MPLVLFPDLYTVQAQIISEELYNAVLESTLDFEVTAAGDLLFHTAKSVSQFLCFRQVFFGLPPCVPAVGNIIVSTFVQQDASYFNPIISIAYSREIISVISHFIKVSTFNDFIDTSFSPSLSNSITRSIL